MNIEPRIPEEKDGHGQDVSMTDKPMPRAQVQPIEPPSSPFGRLSPELRNQIYELVLLEAAPIDIIAEQRPALLHTCPQLRQEALGLYYHQNAFTFTTTSTDENALRDITRWLKCIG
jgi:hypothetical protein